MATTTALCQVTTGMCWPAASRAIARSSTFVARRQSAQRHWSRRRGLAAMACITRRSWRFPATTRRHGGTAGARRRRASIQSPCERTDIFMLIHPETRDPDDEWPWPEPRPPQSEYDEDFPESAEMRRIRKERQQQDGE